MDRTTFSRRQLLAGSLVGLGAVVAESSLGRLQKGAFASEACATGSAGPGLVSPLEAMKAPREQFLYTVCHYSGTGVDQPDFLGVVDVHPESDTYGKIIHRTSMPHVGDELHHFGWQTCSSSNGSCGLERHLILPGFRSSRVHWYQPRHNVMVTSEFAAPNTYEGGFQLDDVKAGKYGQRLHVWDLKSCRHLQTIDFGDQGLVPLEIRGLHDPAKAGGYVAVALCITIWHWRPGTHEVGGRLDH